MFNQTKAKKHSGDLVIDDLSENSHRIRRNLIVFSSIALFYKLAGVTIGKDVNFNGLILTGLDSIDIIVMMKLLVMYHLVHFSLIAIGHLKYLQIRTTKSDIDSKHFSLYKWWSENLPIIIDSFDKKRIEDIQKFIIKCDDYIAKNDVGKFQSIINDIRTHLFKIQDGITVLSQGVIEESLKKFDKSINAYRNVEKVRWIAFELWLPLFLGLWAFWIL